MTDTYRDLLAFAHEITWRAGRLTLAHYQTGVATEAKADASPVTIADRGAEQLLRAAIADRFPADAILGEESGETGAGAERRWLVDPIDGTRSFVRGVPFYGVMLALEVAGEVVLGVLHFPALSETVAAARGEGCWWNGRRAHVSREARLRAALVCATDAESIERAGYGEGWDRLRTRAGLVRTWGDCYGYALVATGRAEAMLDAVMSPWDAAALSPIIAEAGGLLTDWHGERHWDRGSIVATNAVLAAEVRSLLRGEG